MSANNNNNYNGYQNYYNNQQQYFVQQQQSSISNSDTFIPTTSTVNQTFQQQQQSSISNSDTFISTTSTVNQSFQQQQQQYQQCYNIQQSSVNQNSTIQQLNYQPVYSNQQQQHQFQYDYQQQMQYNSTDNMSNLIIPLQQIDTNIINGQQLYNQPTSVTISIQPTDTNELNTKNILKAIKENTCQVCLSHKSVGLHYGAVTCEACKKFFNRFHDKQNDPSNVCNRKTGDCLVTMASRTICTSCRLNKCFEVGMDCNSKIQNI